MQQPSHNTTIYNQLITPKAYRKAMFLLNENPEIKLLVSKANSEEDFSDGLKDIATKQLKTNKAAFSYYKGESKGREAYKELDWKDIAAIRILDYIDYSGRDFEDPNRTMKVVRNEPIKLFWLALKHGKGGVSTAFITDMTYLFRQLNGTLIADCSTSKVESWMDRHPSGLDPKIVNIRKENKNRIISIIIRLIDEGKVNSSSFFFEPGITEDEKQKLVQTWWNDKKFHLKFAIKRPDLLNEMLGYSLKDMTMKRLCKAQEKGIPFFVNPYYLSLLITEVDEFSIGADLAIRDYILYSKELLEEYGKIIAWEKEDEVEPGKPNEAGWLLPNESNIHRRYPEVAILIPDTVGRACAGLCTSCQRMYDFQSGHLNFNLEKLKPKKRWKNKLHDLMKYFEDDSQLRDILITGGDALMSSDHSINEILEAVYEMAVRKRDANLNRKEGEKYAEILRVRLGTRLPIYLPQRITPELITILKDFRTKALKVGFIQFFIQTHFESAMEITTEVKKAISMIHSAGWIVTNQLVFTAAASRRGHTAKLRKVLNENGVLNYYTFTVKGYMDTRHNFATNARAVQEQFEEKAAGILSDKQLETLYSFTEDPSTLSTNIKSFIKKENVPFLATDRNVLNLPGVGKSLTFRTIGLTPDGRRILLFDHDITRKHSPVINDIGKIPIIESKSIADYIDQLSDSGEDTSEYESVYGYSIGETESKFSLYDYPEYDFSSTKELSNYRKR